MKCPFPGMDPWLEHPHLWPGLHNELVAEISRDLCPRLPEGYYVALEERIFIQEPGEKEAYARPDITVMRDPGRPAAREGRFLEAEEGALLVDVPIPDEFKETYLEVRTTDHVTVTVIELLSPSNKRQGTGRNLYLSKRSEVRGSFTHLVEIDLLRAGEPMPMSGADVRGMYSILVCRGGSMRGRLYRFGVRDRIPPFRVPLHRKEEGPHVCLGEILHPLYDRARYHLRVDYSMDPVPPLSGADRTWCAALLPSPA